MEETTHRNTGLQHFTHARRQAQLDTLSARLTGRDTTLLPFDAIRTQLRQQSPLYRGVREVPLDEIVGSVGRYKDLTRRFLPLTNAMQERFVRITSLAISEGWPPIELYQVGGVYFVKDGNHRVAAARQLEYPTIEAYVWEYPEDVDIGPEDTLDDILIRFGERNFMQLTGLEERIPDHGIQFTTPGRYTELRAQIADLRAKLAAIDDEEMPYPDAVDAWYEMRYLPAVQIIRESGMLNSFPGRTEADMFAWMSVTREPLQECYGDFGNLADLAQLLAHEYGEGGLSKLSRQVKGVFNSQPLPQLPELDSNQEESA
jgi:hypothetical protein